MFGGFPPKKDAFPPNFFLLFIHFQDKTCFKFKKPIIQLLETIEV